jgi:hypothetical protein
LLAPQHRKQLLVLAPHSYPILLFVIRENMCHLTDPLAGFQDFRPEVDSTVQSSLHDQAQMGALFFRYPVNRVNDSLEAIMEAEAWGTQRWLPIIGDCTPHCQTISSDRCRLSISPLFQMMDQRA